LAIGSVNSAINAEHSADGSCGSFPNCRTFTVTGRHLYLQLLTVHSWSDPHCESLRAVCGSLFAASGQNLPRAAALHAAFLGPWGWSANPLAAISTQRMSRFTTPFSAETVLITSDFHAQPFYGKAFLVLSPV
jgi:hypothetical protein